MKINFFASIITLLAAMLFSSILNAQTTARVQVIHNAADAAAASVDVWLVASPFPPAILLDDFNFRTASPFVDAPAGTPITIGVAPSNSTAITDTIASFTVTLTANETYIVVANGIVSASGYSPAPAFNLDIMAMGREAATMMGNTDVLVYHGSTDAPTVDVAEVSVPAGTVVNNISYSEFQGYLQLATADYVLEVQNMAGTSTVESYDAPLSTLGLGGAAITVLASGFLDPSMNSNGPAFGLYAALATGGPLVALPVTPKTARVQVIHNAADLAAATVDVYLDGAILLDDFNFRTASPFVDAPAGVQIEVAVAPGNSTSVADSLKRFFYTLMPNETYVLVANGIVSGSGYSPAPAFNLDVMAMGREAATMMGNTDVLVYHGSTDAPTVDVAEVSVPAGTVVDDISYSEFQGYLELGTADYVLEVQNMAGTSTVESYDAPLSTLGLGGAAITVLASGFLDPTMNSNGPAFGLYAALATGGPLVALPVTPKTARVQVIHNAADLAAATVDVYLDGAILLDDFNFRTASPFVDAPAGVQIEVAVAPGNSMSVADSLKRFFYTLMPNETYVLVANGIVSGSGYSPAPAFNLDVMAMGREAATMMGNTDVLVYHGSTDAPTVDVAEVSVPAGTIVDDISYTEFQGYLELATADYVLEVQNMAGTSTVESYDAPLSTLGLGGEAITVLASGFLDPTMNSNGPAFGLYVALAAGGPLVALPVTPKTARVQVIHNAADLAAATVDVYLDGALLLDDFDFRTSSPFVDAPAGVQIEVAVAPGNSTSVADSLKSFLYTLAQDETYILIANGIVSATGYSPATPFNIDVMAMGREAATMATNTDVLVYHGSTDAPTVDVAEVGVGAGTIVDDISYSEFEGYLELATADYVLEVQTAAGAKVAAFDAPLSTLMLDGAAITVLASGFLDPTMNSNGAGFGLYASLAAGGPLVMLPPSSNSIDDLRNTLGLSAYPNPTSGIVNLQLATDFATDVNIEVMDATGRTVYTRNDSRVNSNGNISPIDLSGMNEGMYIIQVRSDNRTGTYKIHLAQ